MGKESLPHTRGDEPADAEYAHEIWAVCPTRVGMNPGCRHSRKGCQCLPHTRGDEPHGIAAATAARYVCPTRVGMNRHVFFFFFWH